MKAKITKAAVERAAPGARDQFIWDTELKGFGVKITPAGKRVYVVQYWQAGRARRYTIGPHGPFTVQQARKRAETVRGQAADQSKPDPAEEKQALRRHDQEIERFKDAVKEFIERDQKPRVRTWKEVERRFETYVIPKWGKRDVRSITRRDVIELLDDLKARRRAPIVNRVFAAVRRFFNWAVKRELVAVSPCMGIGKADLVPEPSRDRVLTTDEIGKVWRAAGELQPYYPFGAFFRLLLLTAQRRSEVANMRWRNVDLDAKVWNLPATSTKADRAHQVPLSAAAVEILEGIGRGKRGDYVFSTTGGLRPISGFSRAKLRLEGEIARAAAEAETESPDEQVETKDQEKGWRLHDLRRTAATGMAEAGVPVSTISRVLNHADGGVTAIYDRHSYLEEKRAALETWARRLQAIIAPATDNVIEIRRGKP